MSTSRETVSDQLATFVKQHRDLKVLLNFLSPFVLLFIWEMSARTGVLDPRLFPPPTQIAALATQMIADGTLTHHTYVSLRRIVPAFLIGSFLGIAVGLSMGLSDRFYAIVDPIVSLLYPLPRVVLLPIVFLFFGITEFARITVLAIGIFLLMAISTVGGARNVDQVYIDAAKDNDAGSYATLREVILPASLPHIFSGLSLSVGTAYVVIVVIEMIASESGLGFLIWDSWGLFNVSQMYVGVFTLGVLGFLSIYGTEWIGKWLTRWNRAS